MSDDLVLRIQEGRVDGIRAQQLVRMDGTVIVSFAVAPGMYLRWVPALGMDIQGPCAGRVGLLPDGPWLVLAYFPEGYPGPMGAWPEGQELGDLGLLRLPAVPPHAPL